MTAGNTASGDDICFAMNLDWPPHKALDSSDDTYAEYAETYDTLYDHLNDETDFYLHQAAHELGASGGILEIGSGTGRLTRHLLATGYTVTAVEPSERMLARAEPRLAQFGLRYQPHHTEIARLLVDERFKLAIAPFGVVAHLLTDAQRLAAYTRVYELLQHGGVFLFDDLPTWLGKESDSTQLYERSRGIDPLSGMTVRLQCNVMDAANEPVSVRYDIIDWLVGDKVARRAIIRIVFRNIPLQDELNLLRRAGFHDFEVFGSFDGTALNTTTLSANTRLIVKCRKA